MPVTGITIWLDSCGRDANSLEEVAKETLGRGGMNVYKPASSSAIGPGLLLFDRVDSELCERVRRCSHDGYRRVLVIAATSTSLKGDDSWRLLAAGASDIFVWDRNNDIASTILARFERWEAIDRLVQSPVVKKHLIGNSRAWISVLRQVVEVAYFTNASVLIIGLSGTGKELVARLIHTLDNRPDKRDLVVLDCTTVVPELSGSEFFGHERGAFTHAFSARDGAFALADGGTLFLDEVAELPTSLQAELLRVVQEQTYKRVGSNAWRRINFRLICATNRNLEEEMEKGSFRGDFYHRIATWRCQLPSLNERREDIPLLVQHFLGELFPGRDPPALDPMVRDYLLARDYPGNVRDLRQLVMRIGQRHVGDGPITVGEVPEDERPTRDALDEGWRDITFEESIRQALFKGLGLKEIKNAAAETAIAVALKDEDGNLKRAAQRLGVTERILQMRRAARRERGGD